MKTGLLALLLIASVAHAEVIQYKRNPAPAGGFTVLTSRACTKSHTWVAFETNAASRVTRVGCYVTEGKFYRIDWESGERAAKISPASLSFADLDDE